ncbi:MAG: hypothetical protein F6K24_50610, partial [Okeania sp. SIO2D1]|nr:hypothetical protein [Okeania sp. SIO2D1]
EDQQVFFLQKKQALFLEEEGDRFSSLKYQKSLEKGIVVPIKLEEDTVILYYQYQDLQQEGKYQFLPLGEELSGKEKVKLSYQDLLEGYRYQVISYYLLYLEKEKYKDSLSGKKELGEKQVKLFQNLPEGEKERAQLSYQEEIKSSYQKKIKLSYQDLPEGEIVWGIVIINNLKWPPSTDYQITFETKEQKWRYYLITNYLKDELSIKDKEGKISFSDFEELESGDPMLDTLNGQFPNSKKYFSESTGEIPCQEAGIKNINLLKSGSVLIEHLPNPPNDRIIQKIPDREEMIQYQVINLLKDSYNLKTKKKQNKG